MPELADITRDEGAMTGAAQLVDAPLPRRASVATIARAVLVAAVLGTALAYMSDDMLNLAIPSVARELGATTRASPPG
jgi:hypothetical protein